MVHEDRAALSGIAVRQAIVGGDDAAEQRDEPGRDCAAAQRAIQTGHQARRTGVHFGLDCQDALYDRRLQSCRRPFPADVTQHHAEPAVGVLIVEEVTPEGPAGTRPGRHIDVEPGVERRRQQLVLNPGSAAKVLASRGLSGVRGLRRADARGASPSIGGGIAILVPPAEFTGF